MNRKSGIRLVLALLVTSLAFTACQKEEGPMEKFGKQVDQAAGDAGDALKDAEEDVEEAAEDAKKALEGEG